MSDARHSPYLPELFNQPGTLLYVGARPDACAWLTELAEAGHHIFLMEVWPENAYGFDGDPRLAGILVQDVRKLLERTCFLPKMPEVDYVFWWHGPEYVRPSEAEPTLRRLEEIAAKLVAVASPWGRYEQGPHAGNPYEARLWPVYPHDLEWLGYETATDGRADEPGSEVVGWKRK